MLPSTSSGFLLEPPSDWANCSWNPFFPFTDRWPHFFRMLQSRLRALCVCLLPRCPHGRTPSSLPTDFSLPLSSSFSFFMSVPGPSSVLTPSVSPFSRNDSSAYWQKAAFSAFFLCEHSNLATDAFLLVSLYLNVESAQARCYLRLSLDSNSVDACPLRQKLDLPWCLPLSCFFSYLSVRDAPFGGSVSG